MDHTYLPTSYMDAIAADRAHLLTQEEATAGNTPISIETTGEGDYELADWIAEHPAQFFRRLRQLSRIDQDVLLSYFVAGKSQRTMMVPFQRLQTYVSQAFRAAVLHLVSGTSVQEKVTTKGRPKREEATRLFHADPPELGLFRVDVTSPGYDSLFLPQRCSRTVTKLPIRDEAASEAVCPRPHRLVLPALIACDENDFPMGSSGGSPPFFCSTGRCPSSPFVRYTLAFMKSRTEGFKGAHGGESRPLCGNLPGRILRRFRCQVGRFFARGRTWMLPPVLDV